MGLLDTLRYKYDVYKLEQRYAHREKRTTYVSTAQYVDGEYFYPSPSSSGADSTAASSPKGSSFAASPIVRVQEVFKRGSKAY